MSKVTTDSNREQRKRWLTVLLLPSPFTCFLKSTGKSKNKTRQKTDIALKLRSLKRLVFVKMLMSHIGEPSFYTRL